MKPVCLIFERRHEKDTCLKSFDENSPGSSPQLLLTVYPLDHFPSIADYAFMSMDGITV